MWLYALLTIYGLGALVPIAAAYEVAFYPFWLALQVEDTLPVRYRVYPRFECNKVPEEDLGNDLFVQNVLIRTAADATGPPKLMVFYQSDPNAPETDPCKISNGRLAAYFTGDKPSQQTLFTDVVGRFTHFMEVTDQSSEWAIMVDWLGMRPGEVAFWEADAQEWFIADMQVEVHDFDADLGFEPDAEYSYPQELEGGGNDLSGLSEDFNYDDRTRMSEENVDEGQSGLAMENARLSVEPSDQVNMLEEKEEDGSDQVGVLPITDWPTIQKPYGTNFAPTQMIPSSEVYQKEFRNWRNMRYKYGDYRALPSSITQEYSWRHLRDMGYIIDEAKEDQIAMERLKEQNEARRLERVYEEDRMKQLGIKEWSTDAGQYDPLEYNHQGFRR